MFNSTAQDFKKLFPEETHDEKVFTFTKEELATVRTWNTIKTMGEMAASVIDNMLNGMLLPKQGIAPKNGVGSIYDPNAGTYTVYVPRVYCGLCKEMAGTEDVDGIKYCKSCLPLVKIKKEMDEKNAATPTSIPKKNTAN